jgi:hypothetical protein
MYGDDDHSGGEEYADECQSHRLRGNCERVPAHCIGTGGEVLQRYEFTLPVNATPTSTSFIAHMSSRVGLHVHMLSPTRV